MFAPRPRAVLVDVGFTLTIYDGARIATLAKEAGVEVTAAAIDATERMLRLELANHSWPLRPGSTSPASGGARLMRRLLELAGARAQGDSTALDVAADFLWKRHLERNLWARVLDGVPEALARLEAAGIQMAVVSNSEGTVEAMLHDVGLRRYFRTVLDSWVVGIAKPDPRIFARALAELDVPAAEAVMVGDSPVADIEGAAAAGVRGALLDPFDLYAGETTPRFAGFSAFADALLRAR